MLVFVTYSKDLVSGLATIVAHLKLGDYRVGEIQSRPQDFQFILLEACEESDLALKHYYWSTRYELDGYRLLNARKALQPRFRVRKCWKSTYCAYMDSRGSNEVILGIFRTRGEARAHCDNLRAMEIPLPVRATNELSNKYFESNKE